MKRSWTRFFVTAALTLLCGVGFSSAQTPEDALQKGFEHPPSAARPRVWWHWMNGNITKEGIKLDLDWMHRAGHRRLSELRRSAANTAGRREAPGIHDAGVEGRVQVCHRCGDQFGMEMAIAGSPGWSETGGPWVTPAQGMKKYVWSETLVEGGKPFAGKLAHPPSTTGAFQNMGFANSLGPRQQSCPEFYADAVVVAFRAASGSTGPEMEQPKITSSGDGLGSRDVERRRSGENHESALPTPDADSWIQFEYPAPHTIRALTFVTKDPGFIQEFVTGIARKTLEASDDGQNFHKVVSLSGGRAPEHTISFDPVTAKYFRVTFKHTPPPPFPPGRRESTSLPSVQRPDCSDHIRSCRTGPALRSAREPL